MTDPAHDGTAALPPRLAYTAVVERCPDTGLFVGYVPGLSGAHSQAETLDKLNANLREVISLILEDGVPPSTDEFMAHRR